MFKQGERSDLNNYRPISVILVIAKVFERIVYDQLYSFLAKEDVISKQQSGFRSLHSTVTALLEATDSWAFNIDNKQQTTKDRLMLKHFAVKRLNYVNFTQLPRSR